MTLVAFASYCQVTPALPTSKKPMPPLRSCGVTVLSTTDGRLTDGISTMLFFARANEPSSSQVFLSAPSYRTVWLWPP